MLVLSTEQDVAVTEMAGTTHRATLLASDTGTGKTLMATELAKRIDARTILIIGPINRPVVNAWRASFENQGVNLPFRKITSARAEVGNFQRLADDEPGIYYVGREFMHLSATALDPKQKKDGSWTTGRDARWTWRMVKPDLAIFDEVQTASNRNSNAYKVLKTINAGYKIAASGTPEGNRFEGLWSVCRWLWPTAEQPDVEHLLPHARLYVDNSFWRWAATWAQVEDDFFAGKKVRGEIVPGTFVNSLPCYIRIEAERTPVDLRRVFVDLTPSQRSMYNDMERDMLVWLDDHPLVADIPLVQRTRLRQITLGEVTLVDNGRLAEDNETVLLDVDFDLDCESSKIEALEKIISKYHPTDPILIFTDSAKFAHVVSHRLGSLAREWSGNVTQKARAEILAAFGTTVRYIVAVIPAIAEGIDMLQHVCSTEVWLNESSNEMMNTQAQGRLNRRGQPAKVITQYKLLAHDTADDDHFNNLVRQRIDQRARLRKER